MSIGPIHDLLLRDHSCIEIAPENATTHVNGSPMCIREFRHEKANLVNFAGLGQPPRRYALAIGQEWHGENKGKDTELVAVNLDDVRFDLDFDEAAAPVFTRRILSSPYFLHTLLFEHEDHLYIPQTSLYWDAAEDSPWFTKGYILLPDERGSKIVAHRIAPDFDDLEFKKDIVRIISSVSAELEMAIESEVMPLVHESGKHGILLEDVTKAASKAKTIAQRFE